MTIHLAFDQLEFGDLALCLTIGLGFCNGGSHGR